MVCVWAMGWQGREYNPICSARSLHALDWANVSVVLRKHNANNPFNQLFAEYEAEPPGDPAVAAAEAIVQIYTFYFFAAISALLGDAFAAVNTYARVCSIIFLLVGNVLFAIIFGGLPLLSDCPLPS